MFSSRPQVVVTAILGAVLMVRPRSECTCGKCPQPDEFSVSPRDLHDSIHDLKVGDKLETATDSSTLLCKVNEFTDDQPDIGSMLGTLQQMFAAGPAGFTPRESTDPTDFFGVPRVVN